MDLTEVEKAAVLLIALGPERAQGILDQLSASEMAPIIEAMGRMGRIEPEVRRAVLEEVNGILMDRAAGQIFGRKGRSESPEASEQPPDLLGRLGPYLPDRFRTDRIDWDAAGFDFGGGSEDGSRPPRPPEGRP